MLTPTQTNWTIPGSIKQSLDGLKKKIITRVLENSLIVGVWGLLAQMVYAVRHAQKVSLRKLFPCTRKNKTKVQLTTSGGCFPVCRCVHFFLFGHLYESLDRSLLSIILQLLLISLHFEP